MRYLGLSAIKINTLPVIPDRAPLAGKAGTTDILVCQMLTGRNACRTDIALFSYTVLKRNTMRVEA